MLSVNELINKKRTSQKISMITAYDFAFAKMAEMAQVDQILVGDSLANVMLGYSSTREIGMEEMLVFTKAVAKGAPHTHIVSDMPYLSDSNAKLALENAKKLIEAGAKSVKLEGAKLEVIETLVANNIAVVGHLGLLPQTASNFKQVGKAPQEELQILKEAELLTKLGVFEIVLEHIPSGLGQKITQEIDAITIGIGAGPFTDGQVLVLHDVLGMHNGKYPPFASPFKDFFSEGVQGIKEYIQSVNSTSN